MNKYFPTDKLYVDFLENVKNNKLDHDLLFVIAGKSGPTGKTYTASFLRKYGYRAVEISENLLNLVSYKDDENHFILGMDLVFIVVLNRPLGVIAD